MGIPLAASLFNPRSQPRAGLLNSLQPHQQLCSAEERSHMWRPVPRKSLEFGEGIVEPLLVVVLNGQPVAEKGIRGLLGEEGFNLFPAGGHGRERTTRKT